MFTPYYNTGDDGGGPVIVQGHDVASSSTSHHALVTPIVVQGKKSHHYPPIHSNQQQLLPSTNTAAATSYGGSSYSHTNTFSATAAATASSVHIHESQWTKGTQQPRRCRDLVWALLFYAHLGTMAWAAVKYAPAAAAQMADDLEYSGKSGGGQQRNLWGQSTVSSSSTSSLETILTTVTSHAWITLRRRLLLITVTDTRQLQQQQQLQRWLDQDEKHESDYDSDSDSDMTVDMQAIVNILGLCGIAGFIISTLAMTLMMNFAESLIKIALWFNIVVTGAVALLAYGSGAMELVILSGVGFVFSAYYAYCVWNRIPFAAANLVAAVTAIRANLGLALFAYTNLLVSFAWSLWWAVAVVATTYVLNDCDKDGNCQRDDVNGVLLFLFLVSYFWTAQVIKNVVHVTVAGTVGTWWFAPREASSCCSRGVRDSYLRAITTSFGSICLGSIIVAIIQAVKEVIQSLRDSDEGGSMLLCCAHCLLGCIESLAEYFNQWAFVFVGLYGYSFMESGMNVMALFRNRGWTAIVADMLVDTVLLMVSLGVGVLTGLVGIFFASAMLLGQASMVITFL
jgi:hypothetical protein